MRGAAGLLSPKKKKMVGVWPGVVAKESKINGFVDGLDMGTRVLEELRMPPVCVRPIMSLDQSCLFLISRSQQSGRT